MLNILEVAVSLKQTMKRAKCSSCLLNNRNQSQKERKREENLPRKANLIRRVEDVHYLIAPLARLCCCCSSWFLLGNKKLKLKLKLIERSESFPWNSLLEYSLTLTESKRTNRSLIKKKTGEFVKQFDSSKPREG